MVLANQTSIGLTFGQILAALTFIGLIVGFAMDLSIRVAELDAKFTAKYEQLEQGRVENKYNIEQGRIENRQEHQILSGKLDDIYNAVQQR